MISEHSNYHRYAGYPFLFGQINTYTFSQIESKMLLFG